MRKYYWSDIYSWDFSWAFYICHGHLNQMIVFLCHSHPCMLLIKNYENSATFFSDCTMQYGGMSEPGFHCRVGYISQFGNKSDWCVPKMYMCDGLKHCSTNKDEDNYVCKCRCILVHICQIMMYITTSIVKDQPTWLATQKIKLQPHSCTQKNQHPPSPLKYST